MLHVPQIKIYFCSHVCIDFCAVSIAASFKGAFRFWDKAGQTISNPRASKALEEGLRWICALPGFEKTRTLIIADAKKRNNGTGFVYKALTERGCVFSRLFGLYVTFMRGCSAYEEAFPAGTLVSAGTRFTKYIINERQLLPTRRSATTALASFTRRSQREGASSRVYSDSI